MLSHGLFFLGVYALGAVTAVAAALLIRGVGLLLSLLEPRPASEAA